jgi:hypothetical protein
MPLSMHQVSVPLVVHTLNALAGLIDKAVEHCRAGGVAEASLLEARLAPDMFPFTRQVQLATDHAKAIAARLAGLENPSFADTETTFPELKARLAKTLDFVRSVPASAFDGAETRDVTLKLAGEMRTIQGLPYFLHFALPNFYFHVTTAYDILRHQGVAVGKRDFIGGIPGL